MEKYITKNSIKYELRGIKKKENAGARPPIEDIIADGNMIGTANMFIEGMNNFLTRFPKLRLDPA